MVLDLMKSGIYYNNGAVLRQFEQKFVNVNFFVPDFYNVVRNTVRVFRETTKKVLKDRHCEF